MNAVQLWNSKLAPEIGWKEAYQHVELTTRAWIINSPRLAHEPISTNELVEAMYPEALAIGAGIAARHRIFKALMALATHGLADCCTRGPERKRAHSNLPIRPWLWHHPKERNIEAVNKCPQCGQEIF